MVDNLNVSPGTVNPVPVAADDIGGGVLAQRVKPVWGPDGTGNDTDVASGKAMPVQLRSPTGVDLTGVAGTPSAAVQSVQGVTGGTPQPYVAQDVSPVSGSQSAAAVLFTADMSGYAGISVQVTSAGTTCTITYETSDDNINWVSTSGVASTAVGASVAVTTSTAVGLICFPKRGRYFRARVSTYTSGTVTVAGNMHSSMPTGAMVGAVASSPFIGGVSAITGGIGTSSAGTQRMTIATDDTMMSSIRSPGLVASVTVTRTADTNAYLANDVLGSSVGATAALDFNLAAISASKILITSIAFERDASAVIVGETSYILHFYNVTPPSALADNVPFDLPSGDRASYLGNVNVGVPLDLGSTLYCEINSVNKQVLLAGTHIFAYLVTVGAYTPTSAAVHKVTLCAVQL